LPTFWGKDTKTASWPPGSSPLEVGRATLNVSGALGMILVSGLSLNYLSLYRPALVENGTVRLEHKKSNVSIDSPYLNAPFSAVHALKAIPIANFETLARLHASHLHQGRNRNHHVLKPSWPLR
jgi:hypothetical protein